MSMAKPFVFISYTHARLDAEYAERLVDRLRANGVEVWIDRELPQSERIPAVIDGRLDACAALIVIMTLSSAESSWVAREISGARQRNKPIFPLLLEGDHFPALKSTRGEVVTHGKMPDADWVQQVKRVCSRPKPPPSPRRLAVIAAAVAASVAAGAGIFAALNGRSAPNTCGDLPTRIENVSMESPGHTGLRPTITITVCAKPSEDHEYWLANYTEGIELAQAVTRYFIKAPVAASGPHQVEHSDGTPEGSRRAYVVVEAAKDRSAQMRQRIHEHTAMTVPGEGTPPTGMRLVSNAVPSVL
jgi:hypothetical protein